jgi:hypothetical protein
MGDITLITLVCYVVTPIAMRQLRSGSNTPLFEERSLFPFPTPLSTARAWYAFNEDIVKLIHLHGTLHLQELVRVKARQQAIIRSIASLDDIIRSIDSPSAFATP